MKKRIAIFLGIILISVCFLGNSFLLHVEATPQTDNGSRSDTQIQQREHNSTLGAKQVTILDSGGNAVSSFGVPIAEYKSPNDFTATFTSATTLTLASLPITISDDSQLIYIRVIPASGTARTYINGSGGVTFREAANVVTISGAGTTPFVTGDAYEVGINGQQKGYDTTNSLIKVQEQSPQWSRYTDVSTLKGTAQNFTADWVDLGSEIDCRGYRELGVWLTVDINDTNNPRVRVLAKHTSAGSEEYNLPIKTVSASDVKVEDEYLEFNVDADQLVILSFSCSNIIPYVQIQIQAGTVGASAGQIDAAYITKGY